MIPWVDFRSLIESQLGKPYKFGAEVSMTDVDPKEFDCSELVEWAYAQFNVKVPDGSYNQFLESYPIGKPRLGDLGFFRKPSGEVYHVGIIMDDEYVLEARGDPFNKVILREIAKWEQFKNFAGWRRLKAVDIAEGVV